MLRELWGMKLRSILIILSIALSIGIYGGLLLLKQNVDSSLNKTYQELHYEHAAFRGYNYFYPENITGIKNVDSNIVEVDYRLTLSVTVVWKGNQYTSSIHGISKIPQPEINRLSLQKGSLLTNKNANETLVDLHFANPQKIIPGSVLQVKLGEYSGNFTVKGIVFSPEHKYMVNPEVVLPEIGTYCVLWMSLEKTQQILGIPSVINEVFIRVKDYSKINQTISKVQHFLESRGVYTRVTLGTHELDHMFMQEDVSYLDKYAAAISSIALLVAAFIIYDSITKLVYSQKQLIGVLRALGGTKRKLITHYSSYGVILTVIGFIIALPLGYWITIEIRDFYVSLIGLPFVETYFSEVPFIKIGIISLFVAILGGILASYRIASLSPSKAMSGFEQEKPLKTPAFLDKIIDILSPKHKITMRIPYRQIFGRKKRTLATITTLIVASLLVVSSLGFSASFNYQMDLYFEHYYQYQLEVYFSHPVNPSQIISQVESIDGVIKSEPMIRQMVMAMSPKNNRTTFISAYPMNTTLRQFHIQQGARIKGEILIGRTLANMLKVKIGDKLTIITKGYQHPVVFSSLKISGILTELIDSEIFTDLETAQKIMGLQSNVTVAAVKINPNKIESVKKALQASALPISTIKDLYKTRESMKTLTQAVMSLNQVMTLIGFLIVTLFSINVITLEVMDREKEIINLRTNGANKWLIRKIIIIEVLFLAIAASLISIPVGYFVTDWLMKKVLGTMMTVTTYMPPDTFLITISVILLGLLVGTIQAVRYALKIDLASATRIRFKT